jgi:SAM-dependent methyltransferase
VPVTAENLQNFVYFCKQHIRGDEKGESQTFLNHFFRAFGHEGALQAGATFEKRVSKGSKNDKTGFADLVWKPRVLIEMKKRGEDLNKHYTQVEKYWMRLAPDRPRYAILSNFDQFWIYDFANQVDTPVDTVSLEELPERSGAFRFMEFENQTPVFRNNQVEVTDRTARKLGELYQLIVERQKRTNSRGFDELKIQRFILQCVLAMFAEDRELLPRDLFISCVEECLNGGSTYDVLGGLFREMNYPGITPAGRYKGVDYFNGGLFSVIHPIELTPEELKFIDACARENWTNIRPSIFGNIFEGAIDPKKRHAHGIHFTSEVDIRQIVRPTISDYWEERIDAASNIGELNKLQMELQSYRVLDPACGSGNFLYVAYQELKRIEKLLLNKIAERRQNPPRQVEMGFVTPLQFYGIDTNPFAVQLARATMMIGRKIAIDKQGLTEPALPLDTLDKNIVCQDALFTEWAKADAIIGNPPFLGGKNMRLVLGDEYVDRVFKNFPKVKDSVDFCTYWFRLAHDNLGEHGRAGLVGTNSISQGKSRVATLDYITQNDGYIHEAISTQPWSGEAAVHVSLVNWCKKEPTTYHLDNRKVSQINSSLTSTTDVSSAVRLSANLNRSFQGVIPVGKGFIITHQIAQDWIKSDQRSQEVLKLLSDATSLAKSPHGKPERWIIDFNDMSLEDASDYVLPLEHIKATVKLERDNNRDERARTNWWGFLRPRPDMRKAIASLSCYFNIPRHSKWFIFIPAQPNWLPGDSTNIVASDDFYILGILTSKVHRQWVKAQSSTLEDRTRYTNTTCFETFPFPQNPLIKLVEQIRAITHDLHNYRTEQMDKKQWGITQLYNKFFNEPSSQLYKLHAKLDQLVMQAYEFSPDDDILERLLKLNLELAEKEKRGESVVGSWASSEII